MRERAVRLAQSPDRRAPASEGAATAATVLVCRVGDERYAIDLPLLEGTDRAAGLTAVPCTPAAYAGVLNVRGQIVTVLDLATLLAPGGPGSVPAAGPAPPAWVLLVSVPPVSAPAAPRPDERVRVGLLVDEVLGVESLTPEQLAPSLTGKEHVRGVTAGGVVLLDLERLLGPGLEVHEGVA